MKETYTKREMIIALVVLVICVMVNFSLLLDLRQSRNNERELSRRLYQAVRMGYNPDRPMTYENK